MLSPTGIGFISQEKKKKKVKKREEQILLTPNLVPYELTKLTNNFNQSNSE